MANLPARQRSPQPGPLLRLCELAQGFPGERGRLERVLDKVCGEFPAGGEFSVAAGPDTCVPEPPADVGLKETGHLTNVRIRNLDAIIAHAAPPLAAGTVTRHRP